MDRVWLLTSTCYGNWLPGDARGFVGQVTDERAGDESKPRVRHAGPGTEYDADIPKLRVASAVRLKGPPVRLTPPQAVAVLGQFRETTRFRGWTLLAAAVMANHFHAVVGVPGDPDPGRVLGDLKSYGSRALSARFGEPASRTWWTERGSWRKLPDDEAVAYVRWKQPDPLAVWPEAEPSAS